MGNEKPAKDSWAQVEHEQLLYFRSLDLRTRLSIVSGMAETVRHIQKLRAAGALKEPAASRPLQQDEDGKAADDSESEPP